MYKTRDTVDGFGAQLQSLITTISMLEINGEKYAYTPITHMDHNYEHDPKFIEKAEEYMNIKKHYPNINDLDKNMVKQILRDERIFISNYFEENINTIVQSQPFQKLKNTFWEGKNKKYFHNECVNVAVHVRRPNSHDSRIQGADTADNYYLQKMNSIRAKYTGAKLLFHIYSQGNASQFSIYLQNDVQLHLNEDLLDTFTGFVCADVLITSASSFSYVAALLSDGEIYYMPFWHKPLDKWNS